MSILPLLSTDQVARFVDEGYIVLEGIISEDLCARAIDEARANEANGAYKNIKVQPHHFSWADALQGSVYREILDMDQVKGAIESLLGPDPLFDHYRIHRTRPLKGIDHKSFLHYHQDCMVELRPFTFDVNVSIYPQQVTKEMGGTMFLPGSQYRRVHNNNLYRYQHIRGSKQLTCAAGTVVLWHGNLWHSGRPNVSDSDRIMFLARMNPRQPQVRTWDTSEMDQEAVAQIFLRGHAWMGGEHPIEWLNRIRQWRYMSDDPNFDFMGYAKRLKTGFAADSNDPFYQSTALQSIPGSAAHEQAVI